MIRSFASILTAAALLCQPYGGLYAQPAPAKLNIVVLEGEGAINNIRQRTAREPIVQVTDENNQPVSGATVVFLLPEGGPGGTFPGGARSLTVVTDNNGRAIARGLQQNQQAGKFQIQVDASYGELTSTTNITQANAMLTAAAGGISGKLIAILAIVGGAAAGGAVYALTNSDNGNGSPVAPPTTISTGSGSVGAPQP
jgi:hypothetical protein